MAKFHFVKDYEANVKKLIATKPIEEAMNLAVGGSYFDALNALPLKKDVEIIIWKIIG